MDEPSAPPTSFATSRPIAVLMVFVAAIVLGYFSYGRLPVRLMPELSYPTITVRTEYPGAAPEEVEKDISQPIEEALGVISGLRRISSVSRADVSDVILEFSWDTEMSEAVQDTLEKLDLVDLAEEAGASLILRFDPSLDPVMELSLSTTRVGEDAGGEAEQRRLRRLGELQIKRRLEPIKGVAAVRVRGGLEEEIHVQLEARRLSRIGLNIADVIRRLEEENVNIAGGKIKEGRADYLVRTVNEFQDLDQIRDTIVTIVDGREVRVRDIGRVVMGHRDREMVTRTAGGPQQSDGAWTSMRPSVQIDIFKEADANIVDLAKRVHAALGPDPRLLDPAEIAATPVAQRASLGLAVDLFTSEDALVEVVADRSVFIESSIAEVRSTAIVGGLLAVLVLFLFLGELRSTVIIGVSIPISLLITFAPLNLLGVSLNIMSLGGLALGIGMLVDSSIVVLESIYRNREEGYDVTEATIRGTKDVAAAVTASTLTTIGVFLPMVFVEGVAGQAFDDLGLAVVLSLLVSLIVALYFIPMLASRTRPTATEHPSGEPDTRPWWMLAAWRGVADDWRSRGWIKRILLLPYLVIKAVLWTSLELIARLALVVLSLPRLFWSVAGDVIKKVAGAIVWLPLTATKKLLEVANRVYPRLIAWSLDHIIAVLAISVACLGVLYVSATSLDSELLPEVYQGEFTIEVALPIGTPLEETEPILAPVEKAILADHDQIETLIVQLGYDATDAQASDQGEHTARFKVLLAPSRDNEASERAVADRIRARLAEIPDLDARLVRPVLFSFKTPVEVEIYGDDLTALRARAEEVRALMASMDALTDVEASLRKGAPEVQISYKREQLRRYNLDIGAVAREVRDQVRGRSSTRYNLGDRRIPIVVRLRRDDRASVEDARRLIVDPKGTGKVTLDAVAHVELGEGPSEVRRISGSRVAVVRANLAEGATLGGAVETLEQRLAAELDWSGEMRAAVTGQSEEWERSQKSLLLALALSVFLVYVVMAAQFESLLYPLIIMASIPLAFVGTFVTLAASGMSLSIVVFLGMIMLAGIVVNNAIVLVDYINILKKRGLGLREAVIRAGVVRLRPILMTTATTVLGLVPMALGLGDGAEIRRPLAITVISGLIASTVLTLIVIPTLYVAADNAKSKVLAAFGRKESAE